MSSVEIEDGFAESLIEHGEVPGFPELNNAQLNAMRRIEWEQLEKMGESDYRIRISEQNLR